MVFSKNVWNQIYAGYKNNVKKIKAKVTYAIVLYEYLEVMN